MTEHQELQVTRKSTDSLSSDEVEGLCDFYGRFVDCPRHMFLHSLNSTDDMYLIRDRYTGDLCGFEAISTITIDMEKRRNIVVYTMYADLDPGIRGRNLLQMIGLRRFVALRLRHPFSKLYWMFTASTYTSYLLLPRNFVDYWPHPQRTMPAYEKALTATIMAQTEREGWDEETGRLRRHGVLRYREGVVIDDQAMLQDPDIRFYAERNPQQHEGDSLICICPLTWKNIAIAVKRMFLRRWRPQSVS